LHDIDAGPIPLGFLAVSSFAPAQSYRMFIIQDSTITKNRTLKRRGVKVLEVQSSKFEKRGNRTIIDQLLKTNNSSLRRDKDDNI